MNNRRLRMLWRVALAMLAMCWFLILGYRYFAVSGQSEYTYDFSKKHWAISLLSPNERLESISCENQGCSQRIIGEPVYFKVRAPVNFSAADIEIQYRNVNQPIVDFGTAAAPNKTGFELQSVQNEILAALINDPAWTVVADQNLLLLQKQADYSTVKEFWKNPNFEKKIAVYDSEIDYQFRLSDYQPAVEPVVIESRLQGAHEFFVYVKEQTLAIDWQFDNQSEDVNKKVQVYSADSGRLAAENNTNSLYLIIRKENLAEGVYRVQLQTQPQVVTTRIQTAQQKFVFNRRLKLADDADSLLRPVQLFADSRQLYFQTSNEQVLQTIKINDRAMDIDERQTLFNDNRALAEPREIFMPKSGLTVMADGPIAFSAAQYFNHQPVNFRSIHTLAQVDFDYILAAYNHPEPNPAADGLIKRLTADLTNAYRENNHYEFMLSAPNIESNQGEITLTQIKIRLHGRQPLIKNIINKLHAWLYE